MRVSMWQSDVEPREIEGVKLPLVIVGEHVDDRGALAIASLKNLGFVAEQLKYDPIDLEIDWCGERRPVDDFAEIIAARSASELILEATTLSFAELFVAAHAGWIAGITRFVFLYVEPKEYTKPLNSSGADSRDFDLSAEIIGFKAIPGRAPFLDGVQKQRGVFLAGFEGGRLERAFEALNIIASTSEVVFGVPAYTPGWEMNSFSNIVPVIEDRHIDGGVFFCPADNPVAMIEFLRKEHESKPKDAVFFIAPLGTKPHGIGALLFALEQDDVGVIYDHPKPKAGRTAMSLTWHLFDARR
jgi:hypothetical protein